MPIFNFNCPNCKASKKILRKTEKEAEGTKCECGSVMERHTQPLTSRTTEIIDNGLMAKKVEVMSNIEESIEKRKQKHNDRFKL